MGSGGSGDGLILSGCLLYQTIVGITGFSFPMGTRTNLLYNNKILLVIF